MRHISQDMSQEGLDKLTKPWEEYVSYPYDDKVPKRRNPSTGRLEYPKWDGGPVSGTVTQGYGHTEKAGAPAIVPGSEWTEVYALQVLLADMAPCERRVNGLLHVDTTQHQYDVLCDLDFNCYSALPHVCSLVNAGDWPAAERVMLQYVNSKGERLNGLVHRRSAEIAYANTPDELPAPQPPHPDVIFSPKAEREPPPRTMVSSKTGSAAATIGAGGVITAIQSANQAAEPLEEAKQHIANLGLMDQLNALTHAPSFGILVGIVIVALAAFVWWDRHNKMANDHV